MMYGSGRLLIAIGSALGLDKLLNRMIDGFGQVLAPNFEAEDDEDPDRVGDRAGPTPPEPR